MDYKTTSATFSDNHKAKIKTSLKKKLGITIQFSPGQIQNGKDEVLLTKRQFSKLEKHKKMEKELELNYHISN